MQYLLHRISFEEVIVTPSKKGYLKNSYCHWVIRQILTQVEKQQEKSIMNSNKNRDNSNAKNENNFTNENNSQSLKSSYHSLHYHTKGSNGKKSLNP